MACFFLGRLTACVNSRHGRRGPLFELIVAPAGPCRRRRAERSRRKLACLSGASRRLTPVATWSRVTTGRRRRTRTRLFIWPTMDTIWSGATPLSESRATLATADRSGQVFPHAAIHTHSSDGGQPLC